MVNEVNAAYAAGILDGEGSITITRNHSGRWPSPQVSVSSTDRELIDWLKNYFGGSISTKKPRQPEHSIAFDWKLTDRRALWFLQIVRPFLVIQRKIRRCDLLLRAYVDCTPRNGRYTEEMMQKKSDFLKEFAQLP